jgi:hypothetical protein
MDISARKTIKGGTFGNSTYDAAATFGRVVAFFKMLGGIFFGVVFLSIGAWLIKSKAVYTKAVIAKVTAPKCNTFTTTDGNGRNTAQTQCNTTLEYTVDGKAYKTAFVLDGSYAQDQMIDIQYNPDNPSDLRQPAPQNKTIGIILILIGLAIMIGSITWFILALKYKVVAAGTAAYAAVDWTTNAFIN